VRVVLASLGLIALIAGPAGATASIGCASEDDGVSFDLTMGNLPVLAVVGAFISVGDRKWSTLEGEGEQVIAGQAFGGTDDMRIDLTDPNVERVVAEIRLWRAMEEDDYALGGTLRVPGVGAWAVTCVGP
jgi:hypothetical protein